MDETGNNIEHLDLPGKDDTAGRCVSSPMLWSETEREQARQELALLAAEVGASGRMQDPEALQLLFPRLLDDLSIYPVDIALLALREHRKQSPFWPALSDLVPIIEGELARRQAEAARRVWAEKERRRAREEAARNAYWESPEGRAERARVAAMMEEWRKQLAQKAARDMAARGGAKDGGNHQHGPEHASEELRRMVLNTESAEGGDHEHD